MVAMSISDYTHSGRPLEMEPENLNDDDAPNGGIATDYFSNPGSDSGAVSSTGRFDRRASLSIKIPPSQVKADMAFSALQYLPMPVLVLSSEKRVVLANESMGRLFGIEPVQDEGSLSHSPTRETRSSTDILCGVTLADLGVDMLSGGNAVFFAWEDFLESIVDDASRAQCSATQLNTYHPRMETTTSGHQRTRSRGSSIRSNGGGDSSMEVHDAVLDVVFSTNRDPNTGLPLESRRADFSSHVQAKLIVSVWANEDQQYFTCTFTASTTTDSISSPPDSAGKVTSRTVTRTTTSLSTISSGSSSSGSGRIFARRQHNREGTPSSSSNIASPGLPPAMDFPPPGPPARSSLTSAPTIFSKTNRLKDAIMNSMSIPAYAMWADGSFGIPNKAAIKMLYPWIEDGLYDSNEQARDFLSRYVLYDEDFSQELTLDMFPIMRLMRERVSFEGYRVGMYSAKDGSRLLYDVQGEVLRDDKGEFLGGLVLFNDVTDFATTIERQQRENEMQFEEISSKVPQMIWRTTPEGSHDYFSDRWYAYTGLTPEQSLGDGWVNAFHPDDLAVAVPKWEHSLATGDEYITEYRARNADGEWRWHIGRAVPMRDLDGKIVKWFGTCTDIDDIILARESAKQTQAHLERVIEHAGITLWAIDRDRRLTVFEGQPMHGGESKQALLGRDIYEIFRAEGREKEIPRYRKPIEAILSGAIQEDTIEVMVEANQKIFRTRLFQLLRQDRTGGVEGEEWTDGVVGASMDVTALRKATEEITVRDRENARLVAQSVAAKEANKMKSSFLATFSHEIRTPINGVIGTVELMLEDEESGHLSAEQREYLENIQRSANGLLTVINDILDFSKVESGRLDIEEVQFDLAIVISDVNKMLSFAAERKGLKYIDDIQLRSRNRVIGDPGRTRQVLTNLLTNSIKFTSEGSVAMRVKIEKETPDLLEVLFAVEDTGIGIEEEVQHKLFQPFTQADSSTARRFGGTGLGLTISKNLVELMHGKISLESKLGVGTKATFRIPFQKVSDQSTDSPVVDIRAIPERLQSEPSLSRASSEHSVSPTAFQPGKSSHKRGDSASNGAQLTLPGESPASELSATERNQTIVLIVEDNAINMQIAQKTISKLGFSVRAVWNGQEALDYLREPSKDQPRPDVVLMDVQMPILDGYSATSMIRNSRPFCNDPEMSVLPIVAMTASAIRGDREKCHAAGMDDYLAKPVKKINLERMLVKWAIEGRKKRAEIKKGSALKRPVGVRQTPSYLSESSSPETARDQLSSEVDKLEFAHRAAFERSSESAGELAILRQQAEEKAISLRDDVLIESGEDPKHRHGQRVNDETQAVNSPDGSNPLTTENVQKFTQAGDRLSHLRGVASRDESDSNSLVATAGDRRSITTAAGQQRDSTSNPSAPSHLVAP